jgi:tetratricopeptide (TPR) repeat protein
LLLCCDILTAQNRNTDSLQNCLKNAKEDTNQVQVLFELAREYIIDGDFSAALDNANKALSLGEKLNFKKGMAAAYTMIARVNQSHGDLKLSLENYYRSLELLKEIGNKKGMATTYNNIGISYMEQGVYVKGIEAYFGSLKIKEELNDKPGIAVTLCNIGNCYGMQKEYKKALEYFIRSLKISRELNDSISRAVANTYESIATASFELGKKKEALYYYKRSLGIRELSNDKIGIAASLNNIGDFYLENDLNTALDYYLRSLSIREEVDDKQGICSSLENVAAVYKEQKKYDQALKIYEREYPIAKATGSLRLEMLVCHSLHELYEKMGKFSESLKFYKQYIAFRDSISNEENTKATVRMEMNYEFAKKEEATKMEQIKRDELAAEEANKQRIIIISVSCILILVMIFAVFAYRSFRQKQKANKEITSQKEIIEQKQKEILDSIHYAERIQRSLLPSEKMIDRILKEKRS